MWVIWLREASCTAYVSCSERPVLLFISMKEPPKIRTKITKLLLLCLHFQQSSWCSGQCVFVDVQKRRRYLQGLSTEGRFLLIAHWILGVQALTEVWVDLVWVLRIVRAMLLVPKERRKKNMAALRSDGSNTWALPATTFQAFLSLLKSKLFNERVRRKENFEKEKE